jgi:NADH-quinone oxidoreductase subunit I
MTAGETGAAGLPARSRGVIALLEENCTVCMLCARECPDWCIYIESHKEPVPGQDYGRPPAGGAADGGSDAGTGPARAPAGRGRQRVRNVLDRFAIDFSLCMYCGICVEVCPYDALFWSPEFSYAETGIAGLTHEQDRLRTWMWTVPPPPAT